MNRHLRALAIVFGIAILATVVALVILNSKDTAVDAAQGNSQPVVINSVLPDFEAQSLSGEKIRISEFAGKIVVVNFWASWCGPCVEEMPSLIKLVKLFPQQIELIAISGDSTREDIDSFLKSFPELQTLPNIHLVWDESKSLSQRYQIYRLPESVLLDGQRKVVKKISGSIDWASSDAVEYIKDLAAHHH